MRQRGADVDHYYDVKADAANKLLENKQFIDKLSRQVNPRRPRLRPAPPANLLFKEGEKHDFTDDEVAALKFELSLVLEPFEHGSLEYRQRAEAFRTEVFKRPKGQRITSLD